MSEELFKQEDKEPTFEDFKNENGFTYWWASDLMTMLGYKDMKSFQIVPFILPLSFKAQHPKHIIANLRSIHHFPYYFNK